VIKMDKWLKRGKVTIKQPPNILLPNPTKIDDTEVACAVTAANDAVIELTGESDAPTPSPSTPSRKRNRSGQYFNYSPEVRLRIAKTCIDAGPAKTARQFSKELGFPVNESTVRNIKKAFLSSPHKPDYKSEMPKGSQGRPTLLPSDIDCLIQDYVRSLRAVGGAVNTNIIIAGATGIVKHKDDRILRANGGSVDLNKVSFLNTK
jgi:hypothetical protein